MGEVASQLIVFIAVITIATSVAVMMSHEADRTSDAVQTQNRNLADAMRTEIKITSISYNTIPDPDVTTIYIRNTGSTRINPRTTDVFIDGYRYGYNSRTTSIEADTLVGSTESWDPSEVLKITISENLESGIHKVRVITGNGVYDEETFST